MSAEQGPRNLAERQIRAMLGGKQVLPGQTDLRDELERLARIRNASFKPEEQEKLMQMKLDRLIPSEADR